MKPTFILLLALASPLPALAGDPASAVAPNVPPADLAIPPAPHLDAQAALKAMTIEPGFGISCALDEPSVVKPVQMIFDEDGRMWVVEMRGFMPDVKGTNEEAPIGRISVHEDLDDDGIYETHSVFLDNLVLPRAIAFAGNGVLVSEHQKLLWVPRVGAHASGGAQVVDPNYASGGNVEHRANGLLRNVDNLYHSAKSGRAYRLSRGQWSMVPTPNKGQFGISKDDYGCLLSNNNSLPAEWEIFPRGLPGTDSPTVKSSIEVFPIRVTPGVNRAYIRSGNGQVVDKDWKLFRATASCSPLFCSGGLPGFGQRVLVSEPAGNLMMSYAAKADGESVSFSRPTRAFLASTEERFRPVNATVGPDGSVYVVDFSSGIIQHKAFLTPYLASQILARHLDDEQPAGYGRIWKITPTGGKPATSARPNLSAATAAQLVPLLANPNPWWRDTAQRLLVDRADLAAVAPLEKLAATHPDPVARVHALWTLRGLGALKPATLGKAFDPKQDRLAMACCQLLAEFRATPQAKEAGALLDRWQNAKAPRRLRAVMAFAAGALAQANAPKSFANTVADAQKHGETNRFFLAGKAQAGKAANAGSPLELKPWDALEVEVRLPGEKNFQEFCGACHGDHGEGTSGIAPPLAGSEWIKGPPSQLIAAVLCGVTGPITVRGSHYSFPTEMPTFAANTALDDAELAAILTYTRSHWGHAESAIFAEQVRAIRSTLPDSPSPLTQAQVRARPLGSDEQPAAAVAEPKWETEPLETPIFAKEDVCGFFGGMGLLTAGILAVGTGIVGLLLAALALLGWLKPNNKR